MKRRGIPDERTINATRRQREKRYRDEQRSDWGRDEFTRDLSQYERFEKLTGDLLQVPKEELDKRRDAD